MKNPSGVVGGRNPNGGQCALRVLKGPNTEGTELIRDLCVKSLEAQRTRRLCRLEGQLLGATISTERAWNQCSFPKESAI